MPLQRKTKQYLLLGAFLSVFPLLFMHGYQKGKERFVFEIRPITKQVFLPNIYHLYSATGKIQPDGRIKAIFQIQSPPPHEQVPYFSVIGSIDTKVQPYYLLSTGNTLYLEKAEFVEPLIHALCAASRGGPEENHPSTVEESIACLPEDEAQLIDLVTKFKPVKVPMP